MSELIEGVKLSLEGEVEKRSETLDRNCIYTKKTELAKLPSYLMVQFVRFYWKKESSTSGTKAGKAKILKAVAFPKILDLYSICSPELKKSLDVGKEFARNKAESILPAEEEESKQKDSNGDVEMTDSQKEEEQKAAASTAHSRAMEQHNKKLAEMKKLDEDLYRTHGQGLDTGNYQLIGVVTHKGRSADGGHYIGWVHHSGDVWHQYDDDIVTEVKTEDILMLKGGGDWHTAYMCLYRKIEVTK